MNKNLTPGEWIAAILVIGFFVGLTVVSFLTAGRVP